jgi:Fe-S oxidoreductase
MFSCTGCMRCRSFCNHENEVGFALFGAREKALEAGVAPKGAQSTVETFRTWSNPFGRELTEFVARYATEGASRYTLFPGCSSLVKRGDLIEDAMEVGRQLGAPLSMCKTSNRCCGYPLYAAGATDAFVAHAEKMAASLADYPEVVVLDPGCAYTLKVVYERVGVTTKSRILTIYEVLASRLEHTEERPRLDEKVAYQDACHLGRGLGQYEEPRALLSAAVERFAEAQDNRAEAGCSGGGGLLPRTSQETAVEVSRRQADRVAPEGETVVTACPTSRRMFERAGRKSEDLLSLMRRWLRT